MKKLTILMTAVVFLVFGPVLLRANDDVAQFPSCKYCGMDRGRFGHSRMLVVYDDGTTEGFCSVHCVAVDLAVVIDRAPKAILVGDYGTKELVDAEKAFWIIGGKMAGVMSARAKWAFRTKADAEAFIGGSGGSLAGFETVVKAAYEDMYQDTKAIRERRAMKRKAQEGPRKMENAGK